MSSVYRHTFTKPFPADATRATVTIRRRGKSLQVPGGRFKGDDGRPVTAPLTKCGTRCRVTAPKWYGWVGGRGVPLCTNKQAAETMLREKLLDHEAGTSPTLAYRQHERRPLAEQLAEWAESLRAGGAGEKHAAQTAGCARRLLGGAGLARVADLAGPDAEAKARAFLSSLRGRRESADLPPGKEAFTREDLAALLGVGRQAVTDLIRRHALPGSGHGKARRYPAATAEALLAMRKRGRSVKTANLYLDAARSFCAWLVARKRLRINPFAEAKGGNAKLDRRHDRRALPADQLRLLIATAAASPRSFLRLAGADRSVLYAVASGTGFRAEELASLRVRSFALDADVPAIHLSAEDSKNGKGAVQPLPPDLAEALRGYLGGRPAGAVVWPGRWFQKAAEMLRGDLAAAGIPYVVEGPDGRPLYADFHALRHSFIALLDKAGATLKEAMQLARHSDPKLTMAVYGRAELNDLAGAVGRLPSVAAEAGTCSPLVVAPDTRGGTVRVAE